MRRVRSSSTPARVRSFVLSTFATLLALIAVAPAPARAADGLPLCDAPGIQRFPSAVFDGFTAHYVAWQDGRRFPGGGGFDIYVESIPIVIASRTLLPEGGGPYDWPVNGIAACASGTAGAPVAVDDDSGGVLVVWPDSRSPQGVYAQRLLPDGSRAGGFPADGKLVKETGFYNGYFDACSDGAGGAYIGYVWYPSGSSTPAFQVLRITRDGVMAPGWPAAGRIVSAAELYEAIALAPDPTGGVIYGYRIYENLLVDRRTSYAGRLSTTGSTTISRNLPGWRSSLPGVLSSVVASDGAGGLFAAWNDGAAPGHYAQHWDAAAVKTWPDSLYGPLLGPLAADGAGGVYLAGIAKSAPNTLRALRRGSTGVADPSWNPAGELVAEPSALGTVRSWADAVGGLRLVWSGDDGEGGGYDVRVMRLRPDGAAVQWYPPGGEIICDAPGNQANPTWAPQSLFIVWEDDRNLATTNRDLWFTYFDGPSPPGHVGPGPVPSIALRAVFPNPARGEVRLRYELADAGAARLELLDVRGRVVRDATADPVAGEVRLDVRGLPSGLYFARLVQGAASAAARVVLIE